MIAPPPIMVTLEGRPVAYEGPEWAEHLRQEAQAYAERGGVALNMGNTSTTTVRATKRTRRAVA